MFVYEKSMSYGKQEEDSPLPVPPGEDPPPPVKEPPDKPVTGPNGPVHDPKKDEGTWL